MPKALSQQLFEIQINILNLRHGINIPPDLIFALGEIHNKLGAAIDSAQQLEESYCTVCKAYLAKHPDALTKFAEAVNAIIPPKVKEDDEECQHNDQKESGTTS